MRRLLSSVCWFSCALCLFCCSAKKTNGGGTSGTGLPGVGNTQGTGGTANGTNTGAGATTGTGNGNGTGTGGGGKSATGSGGKTAGSGGTTSSGQGGTTSGSGGTTSGGGGTPGNPGTSSASVLQHHNNATRDGLYIDSAFTLAAAANLHRDKTFNATIAGPTYAQPLYFENGPGGKDVVIVATEQNQVSALSAADGSVVWQKMLGAAAPRASLPCGNIDPLGITGTPIIDAASRTLFLDTMTTGPKHMVHALSLDDGSEKTGWPVDADASFKAGSTTFDSSVQNERGALAILNNTLYVPYGGHWGDCGQYHGWVAGIPLDNPSGVKAWATRATAGGIWAPGGIASDGTSLFVATGNTMGATTWSDGEAVIRLPTSLVFSQMDADYFAASNWQQLDSGDIDIGGSGPVLFSVKGATPSDLAVALGKDGTAYLLGRPALGGLGKPLHSLKVSSQQLITAATAYTTAMGSYVAFRGAGSACPGGGMGQVTAIKISAASPPQISVAWCAGGSGSGAPITTTSDGTADPIVWWVNAESGNKLFGFNGDTGAVVFNGGGTDEQMMAVNRFQTPIVAKGRIFVAGSNAVYAFSVK